MKSPWLSAFFWLPLSLGLSFFSWYGSLARELNHHAGKEVQRPLPWAIWAIIPGVHLYLFFRLGQLMESVELENQYRFTSPTLAMLLSIVPPLGVFYLQRSATMHWRLHAQNG